MLKDAVSNFADPGHSKCTKGYMPAVEGCDATFLQSGDLIIHGRIHTGDKPFACKTCSAAFARRSSLNNHRRTHHLCTWPGCSAAYKDPYYLAKHVLRAHEQTRPHSCTWPDCDKAFVTAAECTIHMRHHTGERPFRCTDCDATFHRKHSLCSHQKSFHTLEGQARQKTSENRLYHALQAGGISARREHRTDHSCVGGSYSNTDFLILARGGVVELESTKHTPRNAKPPGWFELLQLELSMATLYPSYSYGSTPTRSE